MATKNLKKIPCKPCKGTGTIVDKTGEKFKCDNCNGRGVKK